MRLNVRTKIILSFFAPIIPLIIIVVIVAVYLLNNLFNEAQRLDYILKQRMKVTDLKLSLGRGLMPVNDYIITGDKKYAYNFNVISEEIEDNLMAVEDVARTSEEKEILKDVKNSWQNIREIALKILAIPEPFGNKDVGRLMEEMDYKWGYPSIERLKRWREIDLREYKDVLERHNNAWSQLWITMALGVGLFLGICTVYIIFYSKIAARNEKELRASEERFRSLAEQLPNMVFINKKGRVVYANVKCVEVTKYKRNEFYSPDFNFLSLIAPEYIELIKANFNRHMKGEEVEPYEYALITKDGRRIEVIQNSVLMDYEGERAILGIITDITERKKMEEKLRQYVDELERFQKVAVKREFRIKELRDEIQNLKLKMHEMERNKR